MMLVSEDSEPTDLGSDLEDAIEASKIPSDKLHELVEALKSVPYLENVELIVGERTDGQPAKVCIDANYKVDSTTMPNVLFHGLLNLSGTTDAELSSLRGARRIFASIQGTTKYKFEDVNSAADIGVISAAACFDDIDERICVYMNESEFNWKQYAIGKVQNYLVRSEKSVSDEDEAEIVLRYITHDLESKNGPEIKCHDLFKMMKEVESLDYVNDANIFMHPDDGDYCDLDIQISYDHKKAAEQLGLDLNDPHSSSRDLPNAVLKDIEKVTGRKCNGAHDEDELGPGYMSSSIDVDSVGKVNGNLEGMMAIMLWPLTPEE